jgi:elongation factor G
MAILKWDLDRVRNIGISAHIDSGKTTLTERILYYTGKIHKIEEVKGKSGVGATMDYMDLEREKGITIQSAATYVTWQDYSVNIIDTPGHVDFTVEVERALACLDGAILVLCGVAGVQSQTITVDRQMRRYNVPRLAFVNKLDRAGANPYRVASQLREKLRFKCALTTIPIGAEDEFKGIIVLPEMKAWYFDGSNGEKIRVEEIPADMLDDAKKYRSELIEQVADVDDNLAEKFLNGEEVSSDELKKAIRRATVGLKFIPVFCGSAYKNKGVQYLLDGVIDYLPNPKEVTNSAFDLTKNNEKVTLASDPSKTLVAWAFKLEDGRYGQLTYVRVYQGTLTKGDTIYNTRTDKKVKVPRLVRMHADEMHDVEKAEAGDIVAMFGVDCASGDTFCHEGVHLAMTGIHVAAAVISMAIQPKDKSSTANFSKALNRFSKEDPTFRVHRDEESSETIISGMGELHLEIYVERMKREYACETIVGQPQVAYRETITQKAALDYTHKKQTGGAGQFAKIVGYMEPLPPESEVTYEFVDEVVGGRIPREYIPACDKRFQEQLKTGGLIGATVVGVRCVVNDGAYHDVDSSELAFKIAAMAAIRESYQKGGPVVLEPIMKLVVEAPEDYQGAVQGLINQRRGVIMGTTSNEGYCSIEAEVPISEMFGYSTILRSSTQGKGEFTMEFKKYNPVPRNIQDKLAKEYQEKRARANK